jgi:hypothetical protein
MFSKKKKTDKSLYKEKAHRVKKSTTTLFIVLLIVQILIFDNINLLVTNMLTKGDQLNRIEVKLQTVFMQDTIRAQQRRMLDAVRQGWVNYINNNPDIELIVKDYAGRYIYKNIDGVSISFDPSTMEKVTRGDKYYDIKDIKTGALIAEKVRPQWNGINVKKVLDIVAAPIKAFGSTGDVIIYDAYTGEMMIDNSEDCRDTPQVLGKDGKRYITLDYLHPNNANPEATKRVVNEQFMWRKDTDSTTGMVYYFSESLDMGKDANNFEKYPLGQYNREFQEKIILPYETVGVDGQPMQIAVVSGSQEQEIVSAYSSIFKDFNLFEDGLQKDIRKNIFAPIASVLLSLITIIVSMYSIKKLWFLCSNFKCPKLCEERLCEKEGQTIN